MSQPLDPEDIASDVVKFLPLVQIAAGLIPGPTGTAIHGLLTAISDPKIVVPVVSLVNELTGAKASKQ